MALVQLATFAPDADPATPGVLTACDNLVPTKEGFSAQFSPVSVGLPTSATSPRGAFVASLLDGSRRTFAATLTQIIEAGSTTWTTRSRGGGYSGTTRFRWTVFGNAVLATNKVEVIQQAAPSANFADIAGAPKAAIVEAVAGFIMAFDYDDGTDTPDGWYCSALFDQTDWTPSIATQSANGRLVETPGRIVAGKALGSDIVAYKNESMYLGRYVGPPLIWQWQRIPGRVGTFSQEAVVVADNKHFFVGADDFWMYDGTRPVSIGAGVREWFFANCPVNDRSKIWASLDEPRGLIYWWFERNSTDTGFTRAIVYNFRENRWGVVSEEIQIPLNYASPQLSYNDLGTKYSTYNDLPLISYDSPFWIAGSFVPAVIKGDTIQQLTDEAGSSSYTTGYFGDMVRFQRLRRFKPRWRVAVPTVASATNYYADELVALPTQDQTIAISRNRFDFLRSARWHQVRVEHTGNVSFNGADVEMVGGSRE